MSNDYDGILIAIEGIDGAGKTTIVDHLAEVGRQMGRDVVTSKEPTRSWTGDVVYDALDREDIGSLTDFYLFCADRAHHIDGIIEPALEDGAVVITDRYADSTRAYQTHRIADAMDVSLDEARAFMDEQFDLWGIEPDLTIYLDIPVDVALERCDRADKYETRAQLSEAVVAYDELYSGCDPSCRRIDGRLPEPAVRRQAAMAMRTVINREHVEKSEGPTYADAARDG